MKRTLYLLMLLLLACCAERGAMRRQMAVADSLVTVNPDSALLYLERIDTAGLRLSERMHLELMRGKAITRAGNPITTDSVARLVAAYYDRHGNRNQRMLAHYYLGSAYRDLGSAPRALEEYQLAASVADTASARCDLPTLMRVHSQMETLFMDQRLYDLQEVENKIAEELSWKIGDTLSALLFEDHKCNRLYLDGRYSECIDSTERVYRRFLTAGLPDNAALVCFCIVKSALMLGDYPRMKKYLDIYATSSYLRENLREVRGGIAPLYNYRGLYYLGMNELDSAEYFFRHAISNKCSFQDNEWHAYECLSYVFEQRQQPDSALKYSRLYAESYYNSFKQANSETIAQMKSLYDYGVEQRIAKEEKANSVRKGRWIEVLTVLVLVVMVVLLYLLYNRARKERQFNQLRLRYLELQNDLLKAQEQLRMLKEQKERTEREQSDKDSHTQSVLQELIKQKERETNKLHTQIENLQKTLLKREASMRGEGMPNKEAADRLSSYEQVLTEMNADLYRPGSAGVPDEMMKRFVRVSEETYPMTTEFLKQTLGLNSDDYHVALLVLAGFNPSTIEVLLNKRPSYATNARKRLLERVFNETGKAEDFDEKLKNFRHNMDGNQFSISFKG